MQPVQYILFDFDGTIVNTKEGITKGVAYALQKFGIFVEDLDTLCPFIGPPLMDSFQEYYGFTEAQAKEGIEHYRVYYRNAGKNECSPYPGVEEMLRHLKEHGKTVLLATSKPLFFAELILKNFNLLQYFDIVSGSCEDGTRTDKAEVIDHALAQCSIQSVAEAVMVGDRKYDIIGAKARGMRSIGVLYGFGNREEFTTAGADYIAADMAELEALLLGGSL